MAEIIKYKELESCSTATQYMAKANVYKTYDTHIKKLKETNEKLEQQLDLYKSVLNEVRDRIQEDIKENEELYSDTPFIIEHENRDLYDYLKILDKVGDK